MAHFVENAFAVSAYCEGPLKQQCLGESGMYRWEDKHFRLHIQSGVLEVFLKIEDTKRYESEPTLMSFVGAKHAKEWSISTPTIGSYGYDVVWDSGRIWSFLASDMPTCRQWVQAINASISHNPVESSRISKVDEKAKIDTEAEVEGVIHPPVMKEKWVTSSSSTTNTKMNYNYNNNDSDNKYNNNNQDNINIIAGSRDLDATHVETHTPGHTHPYPTTQATTEKYGAYHQTSDTQHHQQEQHQGQQQEQQQQEQQQQKNQPLEDGTRKPTTPCGHGNTVKFHPPLHVGGNNSNSDDDHSSSISAIPLVPSSDGSPESCQETNEDNTKVRLDTSHKMEPFRMSATAGFEYSHEDNSTATSERPDTQNNRPYPHSDRKDRDRDRDRGRELNIDSHHDNPEIGGEVGGNNRNVSSAHFHQQDKEKEKVEERIMVENSHHAFPDDVEMNHNEIKLLRRQQRQLDTHNEELQYDLDTTRQQLKEIKEDSSRRCRDLEWQLAQAQELQVKSTVQHSHEVEQALIRAQVESQKLYELSSKALKEQTRREVSCLQDELVDERKRYGTMLLQEKKMRSQADTKESELRIKYANLVEKDSQLEKQLEQKTAEFHAAKMSWEREKNECERAHDARVQKIIEEKDQLLFETQETARKKVDSITATLNRSIKDMEVCMYALFY